MKLIYGTGNQEKINQVRDYIKATDLDLEIISIKELGFNEEIEENGITFEENSIIKANAIKEYCDRNNIEGIIITDDAGLCVECLGGRPGVYSARYAGDHAPQEVVLNKLLNEMREIEEKTGIKNRNAKFKCALTAVLPDNRQYTVLGETKGYILEKPGTMGKLTYCPVFVPEGFDKPMSEIDDKDLSKTHREKALLKIIDILSKTT